jgi:F-type H+-transporting ATPase subunit delta
METSVLRNYAIALYERAGEENQVPALMRGLDRLASAVAATPELARLAEHPGIALEDKLSLLLTALEPESPAPLSEFLRLLLERHHVVHLPELTRLVASLHEERQGRQPVRVETSALLTEEQLERLGAALARLVGQEVSVRQELAPELLGGLRVHVNSEQLDESLVGRLRQMEAFLRARLEQASEAERPESN